MDKLQKKVVLHTIHDSMLLGNGQKASSPSSSYHALHAIAK